MISRKIDQPSLKEDLQVVCNHVVAPGPAWGGDPAQYQLSWNFGGPCSTEAKEMQILPQPMVVQWQNKRWNKSAKLRNRNSEKIQMLTTIRHFTTWGVMWPILYVNHNKPISVIVHGTEIWHKGNLQPSQKLLFWNEALPLSPSVKHQSLANDFSVFFCDKIINIMEALEPTSPDQIDICTELEFQTELLLDALKEVTSDYMVNCIKSSPDKSCELDQMPTKVLKENVELVIPCIRDIINLSIKRVLWHQILRKHCSSFPKKSNLELISKNCRLVSNLSYLSKLIEKTVSSQLTSYNNTPGKTESLQSAYKQGHSTKNALLKVMTDMLAALDNKDITCLVLFKCGFWNG